MVRFDRELISFRDIWFKVFFMLSFFTHVWIIQFSISNIPENCQTIRSFDFTI
jgi:hypothetical protein